MIWAVQFELSIFKALLGNWHQQPNCKVRLPWNAGRRCAMLSDGQEIKEHSPAVLCGPHWMPNKTHLCGSFILISQPFVFEMSVANPAL